MPPLLYHGLDEKVAVPDGEAYAVVSGMEANAKSWRWSWRCTSYVLLNNHPVHCTVYSETYWTIIMHQQFYVLRTVCFRCASKKEGKRHGSGIEASTYIKSSADSKYVSSQFIVHSFHSSSIDSFRYRSQTLHMQIQEPVKDGYQSWLLLHTVISFLSFMVDVVMYPVCFVSVRQAHLLRDPRSRSRRLMCGSSSPSSSSSTGAGVRRSVRRLGRRRRFELMLLAESSGASEMPSSRNSSSGPLSNPLPTAEGVPMRAST